MKKIYFLACVLISPGIVQGMSVSKLFQVELTEAVSHLAGNEGLEIVALTYRKPYDSRYDMGILSPMSRLIFMQNGSIVGGESLGNGVIRESIQVENGIVIAKVRPDDDSYEIVDFFLIEKDGGISQLPSLNTVLAGLTLLESGKILAYSHRSAWLLEEQQWTSIDLNGSIIEYAIRQIASSSQGYVVSSQDRLYGLRSLDKGADWVNNIQIRQLACFDVSCLGISQEKGIIQMTHIDSCNGAMNVRQIKTLQGATLMGTSSRKGSVILLLAYGSDNYSVARRAYFIGSLNDPESGRVYDLPEKTTHLLLMETYVIGATSEGVVFKFNL